MKKRFSLLMLTYVFSLFAEAPPTHSKECKEIFYQNYLNAEDTTETLYWIASFVLEETQSSISPSQLVSAFKTIATTPEIEERYASIYASHFDGQEVDDVRELIHNDLYMKYRSPLENANYDCHLETMSILTELAMSLKANTLPARELIQLDKNNVRDVLESNRYVIIDVYTDWCGPCKKFAPVFKELNDEYGDRYAFAKLNAEEEESLTQAFKVHGFPTILFIKDGQEVGRNVGFMSKEKFLSKVKQFFGE